MAVLVTGGAGYIGSHTGGGMISDKEDIVGGGSLYKGAEKGGLWGKIFCGGFKDGKVLTKIF